MSKLKKKLKTQGKNSKLEVKTRKVGTFRIPGCQKASKKSLAYLKENLYLYTSLYISRICKEQSRQNLLAVDLMYYLVSCQIDRGSSQPKVDSIESRSVIRS